MSKKQHYVNNKTFFDEIVKYRKECEEAEKLGKEKPRIPNYVGECIMMIAEKLSNKPCFNNYSFKDEMISDGIENGIMYFHDFNPEIGQNPFAYFTQIIYYAFLRRIRREEINRYTIYKNFQHTMIHGSTNVLDTMPKTSIQEGDDHIITMELYDNINVFMKKFEKREEEIRIKRKEAKQNLQQYYEDKNGKQ